MLRTVGVITTCQKINDSDWRRPDLGPIQGGILADGIGCVVGGLLAAALAALALPAIASSHPLGNLTINHSSSLVVSGDRAYVHYVLDMAEIPTLQSGRIDVAALSRRLVLTVDGNVYGRVTPERFAQVVEEALEDR